MSSEILICPICRTEYELQLSFKDDEEIVSQTRCKCIRKSEKEKFDLAIKEPAKKFNIKLTGVKNEKSNRITNQISKARKSYSQK